MTTQLKFYGQFDIQLDKYLYEHFFKDVKNGTSIEAGASNGILENSTKFFEEYLNWKTINVEPLPDWFNDLVINRPNSININRAIHPMNDDLDVEFYIPYLEEYSYTNHLGSINLNNLKKYNTEIKCIQVKSITYNKIITDHNIKSLDLFVLDIEGYEIEFLKTFHNWIIYPKVFVIEIGHIDEEVIHNIIHSKYNLYSKQYVNNIYILKT